MTSTTDTEVWALIERAQAGDRSAWVDLYRRYRNQVMGFVLRCLGPGNGPLAEDIVGDTFARAIKSVSTLRHQGSTPRAWLFTIARNLVYDEFKSAHHRREFADDLPLDFLVIDDDPQVNPETLVTGYLRNVALLSAVSTLEQASQREVLTLRYLHGLPVAEVAFLMGRPESAIKALTHRAVQSLRERLPEGFER